MNLKLTQAWGWLVAGVLAAGLNASYHDGGLGWAHQMANQISYKVEHRSVAVLDLALGHTDQFASEARLLTAREETPFTPASPAVQTGVARSQTSVEPKLDQPKLDQPKLDQPKLDRPGLELSGFDQAALSRFEVQSARREAQLARLEAGRAQLQNQIEAKLEAESGRLRVTAGAFVPASLKALAAPVGCTRLRMDVRRMPMIRIQAPAIDVTSGSDPI